MRQNDESSAEPHVRDILRRTRKRYSAEKKIRIVLDGNGSRLEISPAVLPERQMNRHFKISSRAAS